MTPYYIKLYKYRHIHYTSHTHIMLAKYNNNKKKLKIIMCKCWNNMLLLCYTFRTWHDNDGLLLWCKVRDDPWKFDDFSSEVTKWYGNTCSWPYIMVMQNKFIYFFFIRRTLILYTEKSLTLDVGRSNFCFRRLS